MQKSRGSPGIRTDLRETEEEIIGVMLLNLGGPDSLRAVRPFLYNLFSDRKIIRLGPQILQKHLAWLIARLRSKKTEKMYSLIGSKSPILDITTAQAKSLEAVLNSSLIAHHSSVSFKVYVAMRYWHPLIEEVAPEISRDGVKKLVALSMYPHYSIATSGSSVSRLKEVIEDYHVKVFSISSWYDHPLYIEALTDTIKKGLYCFTSISGEEGAEGLKDVQVLFSAHNLPVRLIEEGDPYVNQIRGTIKEIVKRLPIMWSLSYQSKSGPVKWLEPSTEETLKKFAKLGYKKILLVPISFVSDHIETLYEIDILYKNMAERLGMTLKRADSLNVHPLFIQAICDLVIRGIRDKGWI